MSEKTTTTGRKQARECPEIWVTLALAEVSVYFEGFVYNQCDRQRREPV